MKMKSIIYSFIGIFIVLIVSCNNEPTEVPEKVSTAFAEMFPGSKDVEWEIDDDDIWEVEYTFRGTKLESSFTEIGEWLETEREVEIENIPENVLKTTKLNYKDWKIEEVEFVQRTDLTGYEISLVKGIEKMEILLDAGGEIIESNLESEDEDD